jgi:hypothetical protein
MLILFWLAGIAGITDGTSNTILVAEKYSRY